MRSVGFMATQYDAGGMSGDTHRITPLDVAHHGSTTKAMRPPKTATWKTRRSRVSEVMGLSMGFVRVGPAWAMPGSSDPRSEEHAMTAPLLPFSASQRRSRERGTHPPGAPALGAPCGPP